MLRGRRYHNLRSRKEIQAAYIFGSVANRTQRPDSDVDIALLVSEKVMRRDPFQYRLDLMSDLMAVLKRNDVDLILLNQASPLLAHRVLSKGKLILERSASARVAFQVRAVNRYRLSYEISSQEHEANFRFSSSATFGSWQKVSSPHRSSNALALVDIAVGFGDDSGVDEYR